MSNQSKFIYLVYSPVQDECTICNAYFSHEDYDKAWRYLQETEKETGCILRLIAVEKYEND